MRSQNRILYDELILYWKDIKIILECFPGKETIFDEFPCIFIRDKEDIFRANDNREILFMYKNVKDIKCYNDKHIITFVM